MKISIVSWLCIVPFLFASAQTSNSYQVDTFPVPQGNDTITLQLSRHFIIASSILVKNDSLTLRTFSFHKSANSLFVTFDTAVSKPLTLTVSYSYLPFNLKPSYSLRTLLLKNDSLDRKKQRAYITQSEGIFTNMFGPELSKTGSISRGFLVGSNRDLTLSSGFRLQMAGKLSHDIDILAALTDENTPIQPQGNTQTLQEIDNVFVEIKSPVYTATLGDFQFSSKTGEFVNINRKLQGAKIMAEYSNFTPQTKIQVTGATSRGKFNTNTFLGIEGVQGPYRLTGKNNERSIIIIAGSEKVFVDGEVMVRGDNNDYSIEYGSAEITFSTRKLITGASRIVVDFEYSDRQFTRNFVGVDAATKLSDGLIFHTNYFREGDDLDAPIDISLSASDKAILSQAGNTVASKSGVSFAGSDSLGIGKGNYAATDTIINGSVIRLYRFEQQTTASLYNIAFSTVGQGNGDYIREGIGRYKFAGLRAGQYAPIIILPGAQLHQMYSVGTSVVPISGLTVDGEYAASNFDQNRFSAIGDNRNSGSALKFSARYHPKNIRLGSSDLGTFDLSFTERYKEKQFLSLDRTDAVEFGRKWSTDSLSSGASADEEIREGTISYAPSEMITLSSGMGTLERKDQFSSVRYDALIAISNKQYPSVSYYIESITGKEKMLSLSNDWLRQKGSTGYTFSNISPAFRYENERRSVKNDLTDSLESSSYGFQLYAPKIAVADFHGIDASTEFELRKDHAANKGDLIPQSNSITQNYAVTVREVRNFSASTILTLREKRFEKEFQNNNINQQTTLLKIQSRYRPFSQGLDLDLFYDAATQRTAKLERVFYKVRKGEGQYVWNDANANGIADLNDEREFTPDRYDGEYIAITLNSDALIPIINLKASSRIRITPNRFMKDANTFLEKVLTNISTETFLRLEERSTEPDTKKIYLMKMNSFLNPATTQTGFQFVQQDFFLFEYNPEYSFRFRFNQRNGLSQFASGTERNFSRERSLRSRFQLTDDISNQTDLIVKNDNAVSSSLINQSRQIANILLSTDLSYRPESNVEIGLKIETSEGEDIVATAPVIADYNGQTVRVVYGFLGNGQIRSEVSREEVLIGYQPAGYSAPYELTSGRDFGKNYLWSISSEYRMGGNVQFSLQYSGRTTSRTNVIHTGRMEVRAYF
jgi:hypothetical protein